MAQWASQQKEHYAFIVKDVWTDDVNDPRQRMARHVLSRGHATIDEIMQAFPMASGPPKGLDIQRSHNREIEFTGLMDQRVYPDASLIDRIKKSFGDLQYVGGAALEGRERVISINKPLLVTLPGFLIAAALATTLGHEATHILQHDHFERAEEAFGKTAAAYIKEGYDQVASNEIADRLFFTHANRDGPSISDHTAYLRTGVEIQARITKLWLRDINAGALCRKIMSNSHLR